MYLGRRAGHEGLEELQAPRPVADWQTKLVVSPAFKGSHEPSSCLHPRPLDAERNHEALEHRQARSLSYKLAPKKATRRSQACIRPAAV